MSFVTKIWRRIKSTPTVLYPAFRIPARRVVDEDTSGRDFVAGETYFEIIVCEQFLQNKREYWTEFNPMTVVLSNFIYDNARQSYPFIVGPNLLKGLEEQLKGTESVRYRDPGFSVRPRIAATA